MSTDTVLDLQDVKFGYDKSDVLIHINDLKISRGESVFLRGPSGSGKSTLLVIKYARSISGLFSNN